MNFPKVKPKRVLIVDDEDFVRELVRIMLESCGIETIEGKNGLEAIEKAQSEKPNLILLDVMMPKMDGYEACRQLKSNPETAQIPIVMLTARSDVSAKELGGRMGVLEYLVKPFSPKKMAERVTELLNHSDPL
ncbi:MAG: PleD family two-component system response regulator [Nitrospiria bacterium]